MKKKIKLVITCSRWILALCILFALSSCSNYVLFKKSEAPAINAGSGNNSKGKPDSTRANYEKPLAIDDKLTVSIWDHDEVSVGSVHSIFSLMEENGKWLAIDPMGEVKLPLVGKVKLVGLTIREATLYLENMYSKYFQNPILNLRVLNNHVTILGEVKKPGNYIFSSDNIRLVDLLGKSEGFTDFARTTKIKVIRGTDKPQETIIDYTNLYSLAGPDAIIHPGDVVYIPPTKGKGSDRFISKLIPIASLISAVVLIFTVATRY